MQALRHFHEKSGGRLWGPFGFRDAFSQRQDWIADSNLAINQGPIVVMIENHRSALLWTLFMGAPEICTALSELGVECPTLGILGQAGT